MSKRRTKPVNVLSPPSRSIVSRAWIAVVLIAGAHRWGPRDASGFARPALETAVG